ncbi:serine O-acetyltransferase [Candidatus Micrarchaeota archaeon]|nr:serine O-acetyltransferase [Candidatus Micrarchaeota archaeon]
MFFLSPFELKGDIDSVFERDPAARSILEVLLCYPGLHALILHRFAHRLYLARIPLIPRLISHGTRFITGIEIHPGAKIGKKFFIDHGMGSVIGETTEIGDNVTMYQGVTLGGTGKHSGKRHPTLGDNVVVGANATILGPVHIGAGSRIGAGSVVVRDVPHDSTIVGVPGRVVRHKGEKTYDVSLEHGKLFDPIESLNAKLEQKMAHLENRVAELEKEKRRSA